MSTYIIYKTTNLANSKIYVGRHLLVTNDEYLGSGILIKRAIKKYGKENFFRETLEVCTSANVNEKEIFWIDKLNSTNKEIGYNIANGGQGGHIIEWTLERKRKMSLLLKGTNLKENNSFYGKKHSEQTKKKMRKPKSENAKFNISKNHANVSGENNPKNIYYFKCSQNKDYWKDFTKIERIGINAKFRKHKKDIILYKEIIIERIKKEFLYGKMD